MSEIDTRRKIGPILDAFYSLLAGVGAVDTETMIRREPTEGEDLDVSNRAIIDFFRGGMDAEPVGVMGGEANTWEILWRSRISLIVNGADGEDDRVKRLDDLADAINALVEPGETLGGLVSLVEIQDMQEPNPELLGGAVGVYDAEIPVLFLYTASTRAG